jgi:hypothetical protein
MFNNNFSQEKIISNFIRLNPTGTITLTDSGTFKLNGAPDKIMTPIQSSKQNLNSVNEGKFICNPNPQNIEKFENYNKEKIKNINNKKNNFNIFFLIFVVIFLLLFLIIYKKYLIKL